MDATLFINILMKILPKLEISRHLYILIDNNNKLVISFRELGWIIINRFAMVDDFVAEVRYLYYNYVLFVRQSKEISNR